MKLELKHLRHNAKYKLWIFGEKKNGFYGWRCESEGGDFRFWDFFQLIHVILVKLLDALVAKAPTRKMEVILFLLPVCLFRLSNFQYKGCLLLCTMHENQDPDSDLSETLLLCKLKPHCRYFKNKNSKDY